MKKFTILFSGLIFLIAIIVYVSSFMKDSVSSDNKENKLTNELVQLEHVDKTNGYILKLPAGWVGYREVSGSFQIPTNSKTWYEIDSKGNNVYGYGTVFTILKISKEEWENMKKDCGERGSSNWGPGCFTEGDILGQTNIFKYIAVWPNSGPGAEGDENWGNLTKEVNEEYLKRNFIVTTTPLSK